MARRDRLKQGEEAKARVMGRLSGGGVTSPSSNSSRRIDRLKSPNVINELKAGINNEVRSMAPEVFNVFEQQKAITNRLTAPQPQQPTSLPSVENQLRTATTAFTPQSANPDLRPMFGPPVPKEVGVNQRQQAAQSSSLTRLGKFAANLATDVIPGNFGNQQVRRPIEQASRIPDIPGVTTVNPVTNFIRGAGDMGSLGLSSYLDRMAGNAEEAEGATQTTAGKVGQFAGAFALPGGRLKAGASLLRNVVRGVGYGTLLGLGMEGGELATGRNDQTLGERAIDVGINAGLGGAGAGVFGSIGALIGRLRKNNVPDEVVQEILALPAPRQRGQANVASTPDVMPGFGGGRLPELPAPGPLGLPAPRMSGPTTGRIAAQANPYRQQFENLMETAQRMQKEGRFTPGREDADLESLWSQMAGREGVSLDELIQRAYPTRTSRVTPDLVQNARANQTAREVAGAPLPVKTRLERLKETQGQVSPAAAPIQRVGRASAKSEVLPANTQPLRPRTELNQAQNILPRFKTPLQEMDEIIKVVQKTRVRDRVYSYLDEAEKAARDRIYKRRNRLSANPIDEWADHAIIMAAKVGKGTIKAADFTEELVKEFGEQIRPHSDRIFRQTKEVLRTQERKASKEGQAADTFNNSGQGNAATFDQKISRGSKKNKVPFSKRLEKLRSDLEDDVISLQGLEKRVAGRVASAEDSLYKSARMFKGTPEKAAQYVQTRLSPIIKSIEDAGKSSDDLGRYALAVHAKDVNTAGYKSGFTNAEIDDVIRHFGTDEMEAARKQLIQINKDLMQEQVAAGNVSSELADVLNNRWQNYIPLFRDMGEGAEGFGGGLSQALANVSNPIKALKGSERAVIDPMENMVKNIFQSINSAERNKVALQLSKLAKIDVEENFIRKLGPDEQVGTKNVVTVREGGQPVKYEVEPEVYKAMLNLDQESSNTLINILSKPASLLRAGATLTPEFSLRNPMRDVLQAFVVSKSGFNPLTDFTAGIIQSVSKGKLYQDWIDNLGAYGNVMSMDRDVHRQALEKVMKEPLSKKFVNVLKLKPLMQMLRWITDTTESATKVGEYRAALRKGVTPQEAAYRSRDIMDFARAGSSVRQANRVIAFLNANLQGKSKLLRAIKENPVGTISRSFAAITAPTIGFYANNYLFANETQKETIREAPDWMKDSFWLVAIPGTDKVARIPKPFDLAPIFANLPERALQFAFEKDPEAFDGFIRRTLNSSGLPAQITGLLPFMEGMSNYSFFREGDIVPQREQRLEYKDQYDPIRTTETAKLLAAGANKLTGGQGAFKNFSSPRIMDNTIKGLTAGLGTYATSAIDSVLQGQIPFTGIKVAPAVVNRPVAPAKSAEQQQLSKAFLVDPLQGGQSMDKFYREREQLQKQKASANINDIRFPKEAEKRLDQLEKTYSHMSDITTEIRSIESSNLSAREKRNQIESLTRERNKLAQEAMGR